MLSAISPVRNPCLAYFYIYTHIYFLFFSLTQQTEGWPVTTLSGNHSVKIIFGRHMDNYSF